MGGRVAALVACCVAAARSTDAPTSLARRGSHISASPARIQINTRSSVVTTMVPRTTQCPNVTSCAANSNCTSCLLAVAAATNVPTASSTSDTPNEATRASSERYLRALLATEACSVESVAPAVLESAIEEIEFVPACAESFGFSSGGPMKGCGEVGYSCFVHPECNACLRTLMANDSKAEAFRSPSCNINSPVIQPILYDVAFECYLGKCTYAKITCSRSENCSRAWAALRAGDATTAAATVEQWPDFALMDNVVSSCTSGSDIGYAYFKARCFARGACKDCFKALTASSNGYIVATTWQTSSECQSIRDNPAPSEISQLLFQMFQSSPRDADLTSCQIAVALCVSAYSNCAECIIGPESNRTSEACRRTLSYSALKPAMGTSVGGLPCVACPREVRENNYIVWATAGVGAVSLLLCLAVVLGIIAYGRHTISMRDRVIVGLMFANAVYSMANVIPVDMLITAPARCGQFYLDSTTIKLGRAWWFCGKFALVGYEQVLLGASIWAFCHGGIAVRFRTEVALHFFCASLGIAAFVAFWIRCTHIDLSGYNSSTQSEARTGAYVHINIDDSQDDDGVAASIDATNRFQAERDQYDRLVQYMLLTWDGFLAVAILLWIRLRVIYHFAMHQWRRQSQTVDELEKTDPWVETRQSEWGCRRDNLRLEQDFYDNIAGPLEKYVWVFVAFACPAVLMSTDYCQNRSAAQDDISTIGDDSGATFHFGSCNLWCEFALSFRSIATVAIYLRSKQRRVELFSLRTLCHRLCNRLCGNGTMKPYQVLEEIPQDVKMELQDFASADDEHAGAPHTAAAWQISEADITIDRKFGGGSFGEVWEGRLHKSTVVAIKVLRGHTTGNSVTSTLGSVVSTIVDTPESVFAKECSTLVQVQHPNLLKFYGCGTTKTSGSRFIVTEFMSQGSLKSVLHKGESGLLTWRLRLSIATQVASGMLHLHGIPIIHRDLKSDNVFLDGAGRAVVGDFGSSRQLRPTVPRVLVSAFTGDQQLIADVNVIDNSRIETVDQLCVGVLDPHGTMTTVAGSLLYMAPEVFRGDKHYGGSVDVYSFGIVMWELATPGQLPWESDFSFDGQDVVFLRLLTDALQSGVRPTIHETAYTEQPAFVEVMQDCWEGDAANRPNFSEVVPKLAACLRDECSVAEHSQPPRAFWSLSD